MHYVKAPNMCLNIPYSDYCQSDREPAPIRSDNRDSTVVDFFQIFTPSG